MPTELSGQSGAVNSLQSAGGIGGLLSVLVTAATTATSDDRSYIYFYDGRGNVGQMLELTGTSANPNYGTIAARYEYDAYGNNLLDPTNSTQSGAYAAANPFQFSTKPRDAETGLSYYGLRYYAAAWGRWINRDPAGEAADANLYRALGNSPTNAVDPLGLDVYVDVTTRIYYSGGKRYIHARFTIVRTGGDATVVPWIGAAFGSVDTETVSMDFPYPCDPRKARGVERVIGETKDTLATLAAAGAAIEQLQSVLDNSLELANILAGAVPGAGMVGSAIADAALGGLNAMAEGQDAAGIMGEAVYAGGESLLQQGAMKAAAKAASGVIGAVAGEGGKVPRARGRGPGETIDPVTGRPVGRFVGTPGGPPMIEPKGGNTIPAGRSGGDTHTTYPNGSNYQRWNPDGHGGKQGPHGHGHGEGGGPGRKGQGPSLDRNGNEVPPNSPDAHWPWP
jgi:RHS repeat-associated protein